MKSRFLIFFSLVSFIIYSGIFIFICQSHISYPGFTEPMEGDVLQHIERIIKGLVPYPKPGADFIALAHMPLYYFISVPFYLLFGDSFAGPRMLSSLCAIASGFLVGWIGWKESKSWVIACLAGALYFSSYRIMDAVLTCALPDSLMLFWLLLGFCFFAYGSTRLHDVLWLLFFSLAFWTKQHGAFYFGFAVLYALFFRRNFVPRWAIILGILLGGPISYLIVGSFLGEGFFYHTFTVPGLWGRNLWISVRRTVFILVCFVPFAVVLTLNYLRQSVDLKRLRLGPVSWFFFSALVSSVITMMVKGSSNNHYIPFIAIFAVTAALGAEALVKSETPRHLIYWLAILAFLSGTITIVSMKSHGDHHIPFLVPFALVAALVILGIVKVLKMKDSSRRVFIGTLLVIGQFAVAFYYPPNYLPNDSYKQGMSRLQSEIAKLKGSVLWINYGNIPAAFTGLKIVRAPSWVAVSDVERQRIAEEDAAKELLGYRNRINSKDIYILSNGRLEGSEILAWKLVAENFEVIRDYGDDFSAIRRITYHWFSGGDDYPRFLYLKRSAVQEDLD